MDLADEATKNLQSCCSVVENYGTENCSAWLRLYWVGFVKPCGGVVCGERERLANYRVRNLSPRTRLGGQGAAGEHSTELSANGLEHGLSA